MNVTPTLTHQSATRLTGGLAFWHGRDEAGIEELSMQKSKTREVYQLDSP